ncbi:hypothetical protein [Streptomyces sp. WMMC1477]|uniref:hypothetical protein n=1 Tax=Streptomyces sp. WMMC1477 TaxID=3015155 RepID=UPI0022B6879D|nr:hypothetical protein [Streptomyces sp. WMMC1477]MCZ7432510.1 hypothetical protein [Streptomyces sp. WMMC1477]
MVRRRGTRAGIAAAAAALCVAGSVPETAVAAELPEYAMAEDAEPVKGAASSAGGPELAPGRYTDSIGPGEEKFYSVTLDASSTVYLAATAAPRPGAEVKGYGDGLSMRLLTTDGEECETRGRTTFDAAGSAHPVSDYAARRIGGGIEECQRAGPYLFEVVRESPEDSDQSRWPIEISHLVEPGLKGTIPGPPSTVPDEDEEVPTLPSGTPRKARGGTGFNDAGGVGAGVWQDRLRPGESRFYRVPVDWGQRLFARLEMPNAPEDDEASLGFLSDAFALQLHNPARAGLYDNTFESYTGEQASGELSTGVVQYGSRFADKGRGTSMAGWYYLQVTLHKELAAYFPDGTDVTLRVVLTGEPKAAPAYDGDAVEAGFGVTDEDREAAADGLTAAEVTEAAADGETMRLVAYTGFGAGTLLLAGLAVWWLVARRRPAGPPGSSAAAVPTGYGYPRQGHGAPYR